MSENANRVVEPSSAVRKGISRRSASGQPQAPRQVGRGRREPIGRRGWRRIARYAGLSIGCFIGFLILVTLELWHADKLAALGMTGNFDYLIRVLLGLTAAASLFGAMRSIGLYRGQVLGGTLELGGPVVAAALVVVGGYLLVPPSAATSPLTIYVHGEAGPQEIVLRSSGHVLLDLGPDRRREPISDRGQAYFAAIPADFRGQEVSVSVESATYETVGPDRKHRLDGNTLYLPVRRKAVRISGRVQDEKGVPLPAVAVTVAGLSATTDVNGRFEFRIPGDRLTEDLTLQAKVSGYSTWRGSVVPNANDVTVILLHEP